MRGPLQRQQGVARLCVLHEPELFLKAFFDECDKGIRRGDFYGRSEGQDFD